MNWVLINYFFSCEQGQKGESETHFGVKAEKITFKVLQEIRKAVQEDIKSRFPDVGEVTIILKNIVHLCHCSEEEFYS